jgi:hypothetical protein
MALFIEQSSGGHDGVAVTRSNISWTQCRCAACGLAAAVLLCAAASLAQAQMFGQNNNAQNNAPPAAGLAPSGDAKPAAVAPPQAANQGQAPSQAPNQAATTGANQPGANQPAANQPDANQASAPSTAPEEKRGFLNGLGQWWDESVANFNAKFKEQQAKLDEFNKKQSDAAKDATQAMKNAADAMFSTSKLIETQQLCPIAGNGAPDCASAATNVCKAKGFSDGRPIDIRTAERCKASLWISGQNPSTANCPVETVLLRVACQQ